ncbi:MAG: cation:proton antiporter, partial [Terrimicrobiaceae bacterium]|nr:cation:proton antiporter [Terrimicrobiaceae bacterium]
MRDLAVFLGAAAAAHALALALRLPAVPILILSGFALASTPWAPPQDFSFTLVEAGVAFLVFTAGIELQPRRFARHLPAVLWVAIGQFLIVGLAGVFFARRLGFSETASLYAGFAISASSTLVVIRHLRSQQQMFQTFGRLVTGVLLLQDAAIIALLVALGAAPEGGSAVAVALAKLLGLAGLAALCHFRWVPLLTGKLNSDDESLLLSSLALLFLFAGAAHALGIPLIAGAFLAGFALASFPGNGLLRGLLGSLADFFHAIFFTALGVFITFAGLAGLVQAVLFAMLVFVLTPPVVAFLAEWRGLNARTGLESGLLLAQTSELGIVLALAGVEAGALSQSQAATIALTAALTMALTPFVATDHVTWRLLRWHPGRARALASLALRDHVLILGFGGAGMWTVKPLVEAGHQVLVVDEDPAVVDALSQSGVAWWRGDASDERTLE